MHGGEVPGAGIMLLFWEASCWRWRQQACVARKYPSPLPGPWATAAGHLVSSAKNCLCSPPRPHSLKEPAWVYHC